MAFLKEGGKLPLSKCMRVWYLAGRKWGWIFFLMRCNGQTCHLGSERLGLMALLHNGLHSSKHSICDRLGLEDSLSKAL